MDNPKIRIESDGVTAVVYLNGERIKSPLLDFSFHGDVENGVCIKWSGVLYKLDKNGNTYVENNEIATEKFHYDSNDMAVKIKEESRKMKKLFISQPMKDKTDEEIKSERAEIVKRVTEKFGKVEVIDSFIEENEPENTNSGLWYLGKSLELLATADCAYFVEGWKDYRGCKIEHECAVQYGIDIVGE